MQTQSSTPGSNILGRLQVGYDCEMVLLFDCPDEVMLERLRGRGQASGRADDNEDTIRKRVQVGAGKTH